jgi:diphosphomevalonate decarboxylase
MIWQASAPSNIALIKYMGKSVSADNRPSNASLSWTLNHLRTYVELSEASADEWNPLQGQNLIPIQLSDKGRDKYLKHLNRLREHWGLKRNFLVRSANNFPSDCGLASSASSFAALTMAVYEVAKTEVSASETLESLSKLSRPGSGSSCRSFFPKWAIWETEGAHAIELPTRELLHAVLVIDSGLKPVTTSLAHERVQTSLLFEDRAERAVLRLEFLLKALKQENWKEAYQICWSESWDMHSLFETSQPTFSYMTPNSLMALRYIQSEWERRGDGPLVTMDAGPNIHLLFRADQQALADELCGGMPVKARIIKSWERPGTRDV